MASLIGKAVIVGLGECVATVLSSGDRELNSITITHDAEAVPLHDGDKKVVGYVWNGDEGATIEIEATPMAGTLAATRTATGIPTPLTEVVLTLFPAIAIGGFSSALITAVGVKWFYAGGATIQATGDATVPWTWRMKIILRKNLTDLTAII